MLFGKRSKRPNAPVARLAARPVVTPADSARGINSVANGPETPSMDISAMKRALDHAAWRDPSFERRKTDEIRAAIRTLERTAACVDLAQERLVEAAETLVQGQASPEQVMRGLLTARFEELLDSLERVATLAQDGQVNLLGGSGSAISGQTTPYRVVQHENGLSLDIGTAGFRYVLTPIDIRRGRAGLAIPILEHGFDDTGETYEVETAVLKAQQRLTKFGERLSQDAIMLVRIAQANEGLEAAEPAPTHPAPTEFVPAEPQQGAPEIATSPANDSLTLQTDSEDAA